VTDAQRERAVRVLTRHCGDGRLTFDELEDRIAQVYAATTDAELLLAFRQLPTFAPDRPAAPAPPFRRGEPGLRPLLTAAWAAWEARQAGRTT